MARKPPTAATIKKLFALSGNRCAFRENDYRCDNIIIDPDGNIIGQICHIEGAEPGGERYNVHSNDEERRSFSNLILLCANHHIITDNIEKYPADLLRKMKWDHESEYLNKKFNVPETVLKDAMNQLQLVITGDLHIHQGISLEEYEKKNKSRISEADAIRFYLGTQKQYLEDLNTPLGHYESGEFVDLAGRLRDNRTVNLDINIAPVTYFRRASSGDQKGLNAKDILLGDKKKTITDTHKFLIGSKETTILLGEPGSGKSVTLRQVALNYTELSETRPKLLKIPIYLQLGSYTQKNEQGEPISIVEFIKYQLKNVIAGGSDLADHVEALLKKMQLVLLFDSMDEMPSGDYTKRSARILEFIHAYGATNKIIVACRVREYSSELKQAELVIEPFSREKVKEYLNKAWDLHADLYLSESEKQTLEERFYSLADESSVFYSFVSNPFFIKLLTNHFFVNKGSLPKDIAEVLHSYVKIKLRREIETGHLKNEEEIDEVHSYLSALSFGMVSENFGAYINLDHDLDRIRSISGMDRQAIYRSVEIAVTCNIARKETDNSFRFSHHRILEYFAAWHWLVFKEQYPIDDERIQNPWMRETLLLRAGLEYNTSRFCEELISLTTPKIKSNLLKAGVRHISIKSLELMGLVDILLICGKTHWKDIDDSTKKNFLQLCDSIVDKGSLVEKVRLTRSLHNVEFSDFSRIYNRLIRVKSDWLTEEIFSSITKNQSDSPEFRDVMDTFFRAINFNNFTRLLLVKKLPKDIRWTVIRNSKAALGKTISTIFISPSIVVFLAFMFWLPRILSLFHISNQVFSIVMLSISSFVMFVVSKSLFMASALLCMMAYLLFPVDPVLGPFYKPAMVSLLLMVVVMQIGEDYKRTKWEKFRLLKAPGLVLNQPYIQRVIIFTVACEIAVNVFNLFNLPRIRLLILAFMMGFALEYIVTGIVKSIARRKIRKAAAMNDPQKLNYLILQLKKSYPPPVYGLFLDEISHVKIREQSIIYTLNELVESQEFLVNPEKLIELIDKLDLRRKQKAVQQLHE